MKRFVPRNRSLFNALLIVAMLGGFFPSMALSASPPPAAEQAAVEAMVAPLAESVNSWQSALAITDSPNPDQPDRTRIADEPLASPQTTPYELIPTRSTTLFFDTFNPIDPRWEFGTTNTGHPASDFVYVHTTVGHDDTYSLFITEQIVFIDTGTSWATITLSVPPDLSDLHLSFWRRRADWWLYNNGHLFCS